MKFIIARTVNIENFAQLSYYINPLSTRPHKNVVWYNKFNNSWLGFSTRGGGVYYINVPSSFTWNATKIGLLDRYTNVYFLVWKALKFDNHYHAHSPSPPPPPKKKKRQLKITN